MIYPYTTEADVFVRNSDLMEGYEISALVSLRGSGHQNVSHSINGNSILVHEDFEKALEECTAILPVFYDPNREIIESEEKDMMFIGQRIDEIIFSKIDKAVEHGKKIIIFNNGSKQAKILIEKVPDDLQICFQNIYSGKSDFAIKEMCHIETPVVCVASAFEGLDKMNILLALYRDLVQQGYNTLAFGTVQGCEIWGINSWPDFMSDIKLNTTEKIIYLNNYIKMLEIQKKPDIILVGVPGGTAPFTNKAPLDFGEMFYKVIKANLPDYFILSLPYAQYHDEDIEKWNKYYNVNFGIKINSYNISPKVILQQMTEQVNAARYLTIDVDTVIKQITEITENNVFCFADQESTKREIDRLLCQLEDYGELEAV